MKTTFSLRSYQSPTISCLILQNHCIAGVGKDLWRLLAPNPMLKQDHQKAFAQHHVQADYEDLQGEIRHNLFGNLCQCLATLIVKKCILMFRGNSLCLFLPTVCVLLLPVHSFPLENTILVFDENLFTSAPAKLEDHLREICTVSCLANSLPIFPLYKFVSE